MFEVVIMNCGLYPFAMGIKCALKSKAKKRMKYLVYKKLQLSKIVKKIPSLRHSEVGLYAYLFN